MSINATLINLYHVCPRECWLHANGITMEHTSDTVADGKLLHENSYPQRAEIHREFDISAISKGGSPLAGKIDYFDARKKEIHETKRSNKAELAHEWQVKFYILLLELNGMSGVSGLLEYPTIRETKEVLLSDSDRLYLEESIAAIEQLLQQEICPPLLHAKICKSCSYFDFCYSTEP